MDAAYKAGAGGQKAAATAAALQLADGPAAEKPGGEQPSQAAVVQW